MTVGIFLDKEHEPTPEQIAQALGASQPHWERIVQFIAASYAMPGVMSFGGKKYGWNVWYRQGGKSLLSLFPQDGYFVAQIVLGREQAAQAQEASLGEATRQALAQTPLLHDGLWLFLPVRTAQDAEDIERLLVIKKKVRKARPAV
jgi:hypothetical protein